MESKQINHGGKRLGAGRKKRDVEATCFSIKIDRSDAETIKRLRLHGKVKKAIKDIVEDAINSTSDEENTF
jgi:hypothetical protein